MGSRRAGRQKQLMGFIFSECVTTYYELRSADTSFLASRRAGRFSSLAAFSWRPVRFRSLTLSFLLPSSLPPSLPPSPRLSQPSPPSGQKFGGTEKEEKKLARKVEGYFLLLPSRSLSEKLTLSASSTAISPILEKEKEHSLSLSACLSDC